MTVDVNKFVQTLVDGLSNGAIYASLALGLVLVHRATHIPNFAQGELAMLAAFIAWEIQDRGAPWIVALLGSMAISFLIGFGIERGVIRWVEGASPLTLLIVTLGSAVDHQQRRRLVLGLPAQGRRVAVPDRADQDRTTATRSSSAGRRSASSSC